ncbi:MAG: ASCH domain-containing protein [Chlamydiales bacterium]
MISRVSSFKLSPGPDQIFKELAVKDLYLLQIKNESKTVEGRINKGIVKELQEGDIIRLFSNSSNERYVKCRLTEVKTFSTFRDMLDYFGLCHCLPEAINIQEGVEIYRNFPGYSEQESIYGVKGFRIQILSENISNI